MFEIQGKHTKAKIFTNNIEEGALSQVYEVCNNIAFKDSNIAIMPDVHKGAGICIGFTAELTDKVVPNVIGVDLGCGMHVVELGQIDINLEKLDKFINENIPSGFNYYDSPKVGLTAEEKRVINDLGLNELNHKSKLGTLGGGNHFIEIDVDEEGNKYLVIHSGSRNFGYKIARHYQDAAEDQYQDKLRNKIDNKIKELKSMGEEQRIEGEIQKIKRTFPKIKKSLMHLTNELKDNYLKDMKVAQEYASRNRKIIGNRILHHLGLLEDINKWETIHNYIGDDNIIRKGAVSAYKGEKLLIPLNMRDGSLICIGKGNPEWNYSAPHGAGRIMSRSQAKEEVNFEDYKESMKGIFSSSVKKSTVDESAFAYKDYQEIIDNIQETVKIKKHIKPIYNYKDN